MHPTLQPRIPNMHNSLKQVLGLPLGHNLDTSRVLARQQKAIQKLLRYQMGPAGSMHAYIPYVVQGSISRIRLGGHQSLAYSQ